MDLRIDSAVKLWLEMIFAWRKATDEGLNDWVEQLALPLVGVLDEIGECHLLQMHKAA